MLAATEVGFGTPLPMSVRVSQRPRLLQFDSPTLRVSFLPQAVLKEASLTYVDANLFKDAFLKAQQENEVLFGKKPDAAIPTAETKTE